MSEEIKDMVRAKYNKIALQSDKKSGSSCCGSTPCCDDNMDYTIMSDEYSHLEGYSEDADLKLGCGIPTEYAAISAGDTVIDLRCPLTRLKSLLIVTRSLMVYYLRRTAVFVRNKFL